MPFNPAYGAAPRPIAPGQTNMAPGRMPMPGGDMPPPSIAGPGGDMPPPPVAGGLRYGGGPRDRIAQALMAVQNPPPAPFPPPQTQLGAPGAPTWAPPPQGPAPSPMMPPPGAPGMPPPGMPPTMPPAQAQPMPASSPLAQQMQMKGY